MARFYRTASAAPIDFMYQANLPLMEKVILANDQYVTQNLQQAAQIGSVAASFPYLQQDEQRAKEIVDGYTKEVDAVTNAIQADPANWRKQIAPMRDLSRKLQSDFKVGEIGKIAGNQAKVKGVFDAIDKQVEEYGKTGKGISAERAEKYKSMFLRNFSGTNYNPETGASETVNVFNPMSNIDIRKRLSEELDKIRADKTNYKRDDATGQEWYFNTKTKELEEITPDRILKIITDRFMGDGQLQDYVRQDAQAGILRGATDEYGNITSPFEYKGVPISAEERYNIDNIRKQIEKEKNPNLKAQLQGQLNNYEVGLSNRRQLHWDNNNPLSSIMRSIGEQYSFRNTTEEDLLRNNSKGSTQFVQAQTTARHNSSLSQAKDLAIMRENGLNDRFNKNLEQRKYEFDNPHEKTGSGTGGKKTGKEDPKVESTVSSLFTNSFQDWTTKDVNGNDVKVLSNEGLSGDIVTFKNQEANIVNGISKADAAMKKLLGNRDPKDLSYQESALYNQLRVSKETLEKNLPEVRSSLTLRRNWYKESVDAALSNNIGARKDEKGNVSPDLTEAEIKLYNKFSNDRDAKAYLKKIEQSAKDAGFLFEGVNTGPYANKFTQWLSTIESDDKDHKGLREEVTEYFRVKGKVDKRRNNFLTQMRYTPIDTDAVNLGTDDAGYVLQSILTNPQGVKLFDHLGERTDKISLEGSGVSWFNASGDNYNMSTVDNSLLDYMTKEGVKAKVEQVGNTTKIGTGNAVVKLTFQDPNKQIPTTPFYMELTPDMQNNVAKRLSNNKDEGVKKIAGNMLDSEANSIRKQLIVPSAKKTAGGSRENDSVTYTIFINNGNQRIPLQVTRFLGDGDVDKLNISKTVNGQQVPLNNTASGIPGWFNGPDDFIDYIKRQREEAQKINLNR